MFNHDKEWGPPAIAGDRVYCASNLLYCFDLFTGELIWQYGDPGDKKNMAGAISTAGQYLICQENDFSHLETQDQLLCINSGTGAFIWKQDMKTMGVGGPAGISASHLFRKTNHELKAYALADGHISWSYSTSGYYLDCPVYFDEQVFCTKNNDQFVLLDARDGQEIWTLDNVLPFMRRDDLVVEKDGNLYFELADYIVAIDTKKGQFLWKYYISPVSIGMVPSSEGALLYTYSSGLTNICLD
jgi:outer membrane protein assembly factor BamB